MILSYRSITLSTAEFGVGRGEVVDVEELKESCAWTFDY
jgi:hypothetical protein